MLVQKDISNIYLGGYTEPSSVYYSDSNYSQYQSLVESVGSVQFVDTGKRFRFYNGVYIGNRTALDFNGTTMRTINLDSLTVISAKDSTINGRVWYFGNNRILTRNGIADFSGNIITSFSYDSITPGIEGDVWAKSGSNIYRGTVSGDTVTFSQTFSVSDHYRNGDIKYSRLGLYYMPSLDYGIDSTLHGWTLFKEGTYTKTYIAQASQYRSTSTDGFAGPDGKLYLRGHRNNYTEDTSRRGRFHKLGTTDEGLVGSTSGTSSNAWLSYGGRAGHFIGNFVSGEINTSNGTGNGYGSNNYYINTSGTITLVQSNAFAYDSTVNGLSGFIDENGRLYPYTSGGGSGVILKTDKTFTNLNRKNPYLWR